MGHTIVVGAGIGGLTTAAVMAKAGERVTLLEAHIYPGGCAGTFFHQGYHFDAGATLAAGFYPGGPMDQVGWATGVAQWPIRHSQHVMTVHLPEGAPVHRLAGDARWEARSEAFGQNSLEFWRWQEKTAEVAWDLGLRIPPWPPAGISDGFHLADDLWRWLFTNSPGAIFALLPDLLRPVAARLGGASTRLRQFIDAQLLISAQTTSEYANSLYAAAALDMPRRGAVYVEGGIGNLARTLAAAAESHGAEILYRHRVHHVQQTANGYLVQTKKQSFEADRVIFNLTPPDISPLLAKDIRTSLGPRPSPPHDAWGAFMLYLGVRADDLPESDSLHHQIVGPGALGEGSSVFVSLSPDWDASRAPEGYRALTLSTHTRLGPWWRLHQEDSSGFQALRDEYQRRLLRLVERVFPGLTNQADLILPATPLSFARFTGRSTGWVGGTPQTHLLRARSPRLGRDLWMVGDTIFPGQSIAAAAMGGLRVTRSILGLPLLDRRRLFQPEPIVPTGRRRGVSTSS